MLVKKMFLYFLLAVISVSDWGCSPKELSAKRNPKPLYKIVAIDEMIVSPQQYKGWIGVRGTVKKIYKEKNIFMLGCADACIFMPIRFKGKMPAPENEIVAYGKLKKQNDGKYIFEAKKLDVK